MARNGNRKLNMVYGEEKEGRIKDANKKLRSEINSLKKQIKKLREDNATLQRGFNKSCNYIQSEHDNFSIEKVIDIVNNFEYKETEKGRQRALENPTDVELDKTEEEKNFMLKNCPKCDKNKEEGFEVMNFQDFSIINCKCGHRTRIESGEGIERN